MAEKIFFMRKKSLENDSLRVTSCRQALSAFLQTALQESCVRYYRDAAKQIQIYILTPEYMVHIRTLTWYLGGQPNGCASFFYKNFLYPISYMHKTKFINKHFI